MKILGYDLPFTKKEVKVEEVKVIPGYQKAASGSYNFIFAVYDGEKNLGEIGAIKSYSLDYQAIRARSWQSFHESEITQTVMKRFEKWVLGSGLKLNAEPIKSVLEASGIGVNVNSFSKSVEARFNLWANSTTSDYSGMGSMQRQASEVFKNAKLGGDCVVVLRYDGAVKVQIIDGEHIQSPVYGSEYWPKELPNGNKIINGIEIDKKGKHVRYFVRQKDFTYTPIEAFGKRSGIRMAFMVYGLKYRIDNTRGVSLFAVVLETLKKLERYKEATVGSAEERQKIVMQVVHKEYSDGEDPQNRNLAKAFEYNPPSDRDIPIDQQGIAIADKISVSTNKQTYNMPIGSELKALESKNELYFKEFYDINFDLVCACLGVPPNVAKSKYDDNFSASRAALKDWEHTLNVERRDFSFQFYNHIYAFWLYTEVLEGRVQAPGYLQAVQEKDYMVLEAYKHSRFIGTPVPHIDPEKEVRAERLKLGETGASLPLTTLEASTEALGCGESIHNMMQYSEELEESKKLKIIVEPDVSPSNDNKD